ncbi:MAG: hypothetical protein ABR562_05430, partial [Thermoplasmatota archaeon]
VSGLPAAQAETHGLEVGVIVPMYRGVAARLADAGIVLDPGSACEVPECPPGETGVPPVCLVAQARPPGCDAPTGGAVCRVAWQPPVPPADVPRPAGVVWVGVPG